MESNLDRQQDRHPTGSTLMAALDRELSPQQNSAVEEHVTKCPQCAAQYERLQQVSGRLAKFHRSIPSLREFELYLPAEVSATRLDGVLSLFRRPQFLMPAAALAAMVAGLMLWINSRASVTHRDRPAPVAGTSPNTGTIAASEPAITPAPRPQAVMVRPRRHARAAAPSLQADLQRHGPNPEQNAPTPQTAEVFWYLPYSDPALAQEGAELVRADLPREAFLMAGVPLANIPPPGPKDRIAADVVIGADGLPRAIRPARQQTTATVIPTRL